MLTIRELIANVEAERNYLDTVNDFMNMGILYNRVARPREERLAARQEIDDLMNIGEVYTRTSVPREERRRIWTQAQNTGSAVWQINKALEVINTIEDRPLPNEHWTYRTSPNNNKALKIKEGGRKFTFNFEVDDDQKRYLYRNLRRVIEEFANKLPVSARWLVNYKTDMGWESFIINKDTVHMIIEQIDNEQLDKHLEEIIEPTNPSESAFHCSIKHINEINFLDVTAYQGLVEENREVLQQRRQQRPRNIRVTNDEANSILSKLEGHERELVQKLLEQASNNYRSREGQFFKYLSSFPHLNLERFQIFNQLTKREIQILDNHNCVLWALKEFGIDEETLTAIRQMIGNRHFPQSKFSEIAELFDIGFTIRYYEPNSSKTRVMKYGKDKAVNVPLILFDDHYMLDESLPMTTFFIKNWKTIQSHRIASKWSLEEQCKIHRYRENKDTYERTKHYHTSIMTILKVLFEEGYFKEIHLGDFMTYNSTLYKQKLAPIINLEYSEKYCTRLKQPFKKKDDEKPKKKLFERNQIVYADFECSTDGDIHKAYLICGMTKDGKSYYAWGENCAKEFLDWEQIIDGTQIYFHNLSYDINFILNIMEKVQGNPIIKSGRTLSIDCVYKNKRLRFRDSYSIISKKLKMFPQMFHLETGDKEIFPYTYYNSEVLANNNYIGDVNEALNHLKKSDHLSFIQNLKKLDCQWEDSHFDMRSYAVYYCNQDVKILHDGFEKFREDLLKEFDLDAYDFVSISSIANKLFEKEVYYPNKNLYDLSGKPREYCSRAVYGGRCMVSDNQKQINETNKPIVDFDAVSLYPSAMARLYTIEGKPRIIDFDCETLLNKLMDDDQEEPTKEKYISGFVVLIKITNVGVKRHFPLIVCNPDIEENTDKGRSINEPCTMYCDHITLQDLIKYQKVDFELINGYYWTGKRDFAIRNQIQKLFLLRKQYKDNDNPVQEIIKLILNSIYGRTILKPIETKIVFKSLDDSFKYIDKNYNTIESFEHLYDSDMVRFKKYKPINNHFNFCMLGINVLSMSKRIMNEVMCLAEDMALKIFYQDTDSMHLYEQDVKKLATKYEEVYGRPLIGKNLGQFHSDFHYINSPNDKHIVAVKSIFCGKKSYVDMLQNENGEIAFHARMKGITMQSLANTANKMFPDEVQVKCHEYDDGCILFLPIGKGEKYSLYSLYKYLYDGYEATFDLCDGTPRFDMKNNFTVSTKTHFLRTIKF